jgi:small subunit ribosomal protein S6
MTPVIDDTDLDTELDLRTYELCLLYGYPIQQKEEQDLLKEVEKLFTEAGGKQLMRDAWGRRGLAYAIEGQMEGSFVIYYYEIDPSKVREIDHALSIMPGVLRHMIVKPPKGYAMVPYANRLEEWLKEKEKLEEDREKKKEEALQKRITEKAMMKAKKVETDKKVESAETKKPMKKEELSTEIEKLISDDNLGL